MKQTLIVRNYVVTGMSPPDFRDYFETLLGKNGTPLRFQSIVAKRDNYYKSFLKPNNFGKTMVPHGGSDGSKWGPSCHGHFSGGNKLKLKNGH